MKRISCFVLLLLCPAYLSAELQPVIEFNQMLCLHIGAEYCPENELGFKGGLGTSIFSIKTISYNFLAVYRVHPGGKNWIFDFEAGLPLAYFDLWEEKYVDWDPNIDGPYAGFVPGISCSIIYVPWGLGVRLGGGPWWEWQENSGWKGPRMMPLISLSFRPFFKT